MTSSIRIASVDSMRVPAILLERLLAVRFLDDAVGTALATGT
jgi:hypothetical protein